MNGGDDGGGDGGEEGGRGRRCIVLGQAEGLILWQLFSWDGEEVGWIDSTVGMLVRISLRERLGRSTDSRCVPLTVVLFNVPAPSLKCG